MNKDDEIALIHLMITHPAGFDVDIAGVLVIRQYEYPVWAVEEEIEFGKGVGKYKIKEFTDPMKAAEFFVERRHTKQLGLDFEKEEMKHASSDQTEKTK